MTIQSKRIEYSDGDHGLQAHMAWNDALDGPGPGVLVAHAWRGRSEFEDRKAEKLAELGYVGFALDLYGKGVLGNSVEENNALMQPLIEDRQMLQRRMHLALETLRGQDEVDPEKTAAMGFCFGGLSVLDLARTGADVQGVASFHGLFNQPGNTQGNSITAKVLAMHGWEDPMATPEQVLDFAEEMTGMGADWQLHAFGNTSHAFTNPEANDAGMGMLYQADADRRSWDLLAGFLAELFV